MTQLSPDSQYREHVRALSDRIVEAQRPLRILDSVKWDANIQERFIAASCREMPAVDRAYYEGRPLHFNPEEKKREFDAIEGDILRLLGREDPLAAMMSRISREYLQVVHMLESRGAPEFHRASVALYGSSRDTLHSGEPTIADMTRWISESLQALGKESSQKNGEKLIPGEQAVEILQQRLSDYFKASQRSVRVKLSDGILSDASAGADYVKINREARFDMRDLRILEVHEGWVHLGTTLNGLNQPYCTFLSKGPPSSTITQEGLAIITEIFHFTSHPARVRTLTNRVLAVQLAEQGANFLEVFRFFRDQELSEPESYRNTSRIFRGSTPIGGPFTKDLAYTKGFVQIYNFLRLAVQKGLMSRIPLLFCGKTTIEDLRVLAMLKEQGLVVEPQFMPACFADPHALTAWLCYSSFLSLLDLRRIEADYAGLL